MIASPCANAWPSASVSLRRVNIVALSGTPYKIVGLGLLHISRLAD